MISKELFDALKQARDVRNRIDLLIPKLDQAIETIQRLAVEVERHEKQKEKQE